MPARDALIAAFVESLTPGWERDAAVKHASIEVDKGVLATAAGLLLDDYAAALAAERAAQAERAEQERLAAEAADKERRDAEQAAELERAATPAPTPSTPEKQGP